MIQATLQKIITKKEFPLCGHQEKKGEPISKDFKSIREMQDWVSKQNKRPRSGYIILDYTEVVE